MIRRVAFIVFAQRVGLSLDEIREELAKLPADRVPNRGDWTKLSSAWSSRIDERIGELERLKAGLTECIGCGCLSLGRCKLANPGDRAAARGPGPRYWIGDPRPAYDGHRLPSLRCPDARSGADLRAVRVPVPRDGRGRAEPSPAERAAGGDRPRRRRAGGRERGGRGPHRR